MGEETTNSGQTFVWKQQYQPFVKLQESANKWMRENKKPVCNACMKEEWDFRQTEDGKKRFGNNVTIEDFSKEADFVFVGRKEHMERSKGNRLKDLKLIEYSWKCKKGHRTTVLFSEEEDLVKQKK